MPESDVNMNAVEHVERMKDAIVDGDIQTVRGILREGFDLECDLFADGKHTALHIAINCGKEDIFRELLNAGSDINRRLEGGATSLHLAAFHSRPGMCQLVLDSGADMHAIDERGYGALHWWTSGALNIEVCEILTKAGCDPNAQDKKGQTPLHEVVRNLYASAALVRAGAKTSFTAENPPKGYLTPFQRAVQGGDESVVRGFVEFCGENLDQCTLDSQTLIQLAKNRPEMRRLLNSMKTEFAVLDAMPENSEIDEAARQNRSSGLSPL